MILTEVEEYVKELAAQYFGCAPDMVSVNVRHYCDKGQADVEKQRETALWYPNDGTRLYFVLSSCVTAYNTNLCVIHANGDMSLVYPEDIKENSFLDGTLLRSVMFSSPEAYATFRYSYNVCVFELKRI